MATWQTQDAKARFSELLDTVATDGPQVISRRGVKTAVIVPIEQWERAVNGSKRTLLEVLQSGPQWDIPLPPRGRMRHRKPIKF